MERFKREDVFTVLNAADAEEYLNTVGYFAERLSELNLNIKDGITDTLRSIETDNCFSFVTDTDNFPLFLPASKVIKPEKKWRAFETIEEFVKIIGDVGTIVTYRIKKESSQEIKGMFIGYIWDSSSRGWIIGLGVNLYRLEKLFKSVEYKHKNSWQPFGVLDES
jgi:hypothetical protein